MVLLAALAGGLLIVGSSPRSMLRHPQALVAPGIELLAPGPLEMPDVVAGSDGLVWAYTQGHLVRLDPASGDTRSWSIADDAAFEGPALAPARGPGVWLAGEATSAGLTVSVSATPSRRLPTSLPCGPRRSPRMEHSGHRPRSAASSGGTVRHGRASPPFGLASLPAPSPSTRAVMCGSRG
jgi:hypothetical protein